MITKQRLEELIEQGATIYSLDTKMYGCVKWLELENQLDKLEFNRYGEVKLFIIDNGWWHWFDLKDLYEDIEWMIEFGNIERTERLELPTWEEIQNVELNRFCSFTDFYGRDCCLSYIRLTNSLSLECNINEEEMEWVCEEWDLTKENYTLACRKCKELFLGEKRDES